MTRTTLSALGRQSRKSPARVVELGRPSLLSPTTTRKLAEFMLHLAEEEKKAEVARQVLCELQDYQPEALFLRMDSKRKGHLQLQDLTAFLEDNGQGAVRKCYPKALFTRMDTLRQGKVALQQFYDFFLPAQNPEMRYQAVHRPLSIPLPNERLSQEVEFMATRLLCHVMRMSQSLSRLRNALVNSPDFKVASAFRELDKEQRGFIRPTDIDHFMREQDIDMSLEESGCAFRTMDLEGRGQVDLTAFHELIQLARLSPKKEELIDPCEVVPVRPK